MALRIKKQLVASRAVTSVGTNSRKYITIHETANSARGANAQAHANLQSNGNSRAASWHWQVDDKQAIQSFPHTARCWHAGSASGNSQSIGVEICVNSDGDFRQVLVNAAALVRKIMRDEGIPLTNVVQHNYWSGKNCPAQIRSGRYGVNWAQFKAMIRDSPEGASDASFLLSYGDRGDLVREYQGKLKRAGYPLVVDGIFGVDTRSAVKRFQADSGLSSDGYLGPDTKRKLDEVLKGVESSTKEDDEMAKQLPETQKKDMRKLLTKAHSIGAFSVDHTDKVDEMSRGEALDLLISYVARTK